MIEFFILINSIHSPRPKVLKFDAELFLGFLLSFFRFLRRKFFSLIRRLHPIENCLFLFGCWCCYQQVWFMRQLLELCGEKIIKWVIVASGIKVVCIILWNMTSANVKFKYVNWVMMIIFTLPFSLVINKKVWINFNPTI